MFVGAAPAVMSEVTQACPQVVNHVPDEFFFCLTGISEAAIMAAVTSGPTTGASRWTCARRPLAVGDTKLHCP